MAYIQYNDDPIQKRVSTAFANLCSSTSSGKKSLRAIDKTLSVFNRSAIDAAFSLANFIYPVDNQNVINFEVCAGETLTIFDNRLHTLSLQPAPVNWIGINPENYPLGQDTEYIEPSGVYGPSSVPGYYLLNSEKNYAKGVLLFIQFSSVDKGGSDVIPEDQKCFIHMWTGINADEEIGPSGIIPGTQPIVMPLNTFYAHFVNPLTMDAHSLINRIDIVNASPDTEGGRGYSLIVNGLVIYTKSNSAVSNCAC